MPKKAKELAAIEVSRLASPGLHFVGGVAGLALLVAESGARSWILRVVIGGKRRDMGLGGYPDVTLALAKEAARTARERIRAGVDPIEEARAAKSALAAAQAAAITFEQAAKTYMSDKEGEWGNAKHRAQWQSTLETYAYPVIGKLLVRDIELAHVLRVLEPMWKEKTETASRVRGRIEKILDWATVRGYRAGPNPARWKGHLENTLAKPSKIAAVEHHAALDFREIGSFMAQLRAHEGMGARALEFAVLTAARSGEVRGATWSEIDLDAGVWAIPAARMKAKRDHRVPLSEPAVALLRALPRFGSLDLVFPSTKGAPLSDMTLTAVLRRMNLEVTAHGFRSTFRDWTAERTAFPREVCEMALAHTISNEVEAAYRRGDLFAKRRQLMDAWALYCGTVAKAGDVLPLRARQGAKA
ncbi:tyrosine-type recombinase/integrase [Paraburkholderia sp. CNPSo 3076]|uniref:tyrosine-type recombinase/integrase n=1 Tax=Paraburkholderia sp. CNPSo 3076 TaxID=2940936 RepID=UPI0022596550|nr:site-specific integrase [Paraburkholderia sp. CNPSo 3076]MCX5542588.1 tyrosine-type recombinase/integrase [Paraburkholderia sp. CNPSo 3076]